MSQYKYSVIVVERKETFSGYPCHTTPANVVWCGDEKGALLQLFDRN